MLNLKNFETFENENIYIPVDVHNKITENVQFEEDIFKKIINFKNQNVLIIGCPDFKQVLGPQKFIGCINFDKTTDDPDSLYVDIKLIKDFNGDKKVSNKVTTLIKEQFPGVVFDKIFNFSLATFNSSVVNYEITAKFNTWLFTTFFQKNITSWYSFDEPDVQDQFEKEIEKLKTSKNYRVNTIGHFDKETWKNYGFTDDTERLLTKIVVDKTDTYKSAEDMEKDESSLSSKPIDTGNLLTGVIEPSIYAFKSDNVNAYIRGEAMKVGDTSRAVSVRMEEWRQVFDDLFFIKSYPAVVKGVDDSLDGRVFRDYSIHKILEKTGHKNLKREEFPDPNKYSHEFFRDVVINDTRDDVQGAIDLLFEALKDHRTDIIAELKEREFRSAEYVEPKHDKPLPYKERDLQTETINKFKVRADAGDKELLMYAVMRFGKTYAACRCAQELPNNRFTIIVSAKADVKDEWVNQVNPYKEFENYDVYTTKGEGSLRDRLRGEGINTLNDYLEQNPEKHIMLFISLQDLDGYTRDRKNVEIKKNFDFFQDTPINLLIIDEAHYGAQGKKYSLGIKEGELADDTYDENDEESKENKLNNRATELIKNSLSIGSDTIKLHLSGTPYDLVARGKFKDESIIANFGFDKLIEAKKAWNDRYEKFILTKKPVEGLFMEDGVTPDPMTGKVLSWDNNPYFGIPDMRQFGYNFDEFKLKEAASEGAISCTSLFRLSNESYKSNPDIKRFMYEDEILKMFKDIDGTERESNILPLLDLTAVKKGNMCKHIVMVLPFRKICDTMEEFLREHKKDLKKLGKYQIVNIAGEKHHLTTPDAKREIANEDAAGNRTISLTVKQMLTGVTVREWDTMFYLKDGESPQEFDQARFRIQTPYIKKLPIYEISDDLENVKIVKNSKGEDEIVKVDMKPQTIFVDFAVNRTYTIMYERACAQVDSEGEKDPHPVRDEDGNLVDRDYEDRVKEKIEKDLACVPLIAYNGDKLVPIEYVNAYEEAYKIHMAGMYKKCGGDYLGYLSNEIDWIALYDKCKDMDTSDWKADYSGTKKTPAKVSGSRVAGGPGSEFADPGVRGGESGGDSGNGEGPVSGGGSASARPEKEFTYSDAADFAAKCKTMIRDILVYILCRNDNTKIEKLKRLLDTMRTDDSSGMEQNWHVALNIFDPEHADVTDVDEVKKYVKKIQKKIKDFTRALKRIPSVETTVKEIIYKAEGDYKDIRKKHEGIKDTLSKFGKGVLGETEFMFENNDLIEKLFKDVVIFKDRLILDCYGSKIGEIPHYLADKHSDFSLKNYYLICRSGMIAELSKVTLKIIMDDQGLNVVKKAKGRSREMYQSEVNDWLNSHILIYDPKVKDIKETVDIPEFDDKALTEKFETFSEFMQKVNEGKYRRLTPEEKLKKQIAKETRRKLNEEKAITKKLEEEGYLVGLKQAIENKWPGMKFDIIVGNPPYGERPSGISATLHLQIMRTVLDFCTDKLCFIMPSKPIIQQLDKEGVWYKMFMNAVCTDVEVVKKGTFKNTTMDDTAIYYIDRKPGSQFCKKFDVDYTIYNAIDDDAHKLFIDKMGKFDSLQIFRTYNVVGKNDETQLKKNVEKWVSEMSDDKYYLNINRANGSLCGKLISGDLVDVGILNKEEEHQFMYKHTSVKNILQCPTKRYGENLKNLMIYGKVLRYGLWLTQTNQNVYQGQLKYIPDVDYETIDTDEKLLSECGFSNDEIEQVMKYLNNFNFSQNRNDVVRESEVEPDSSPSGSGSSKPVVDDEDEETQEELGRQSILDRNNDEDED